MTKSWHKAVAGLLQLWLASCLPIPRIGSGYPYRSNPQWLVIGNCWVNLGLALLPLVLWYARLRFVGWRLSVTILRNWKLTQKKRFLFLCLYFRVFTSCRRSSLSNPTYARTCRAWVWVFLKSNVFLGLKNGSDKMGARKWAQIHPFLKLIWSLLTPGCWEGGRPVVVTPSPSNPRSPEREFHQPGHFSEIRLLLVIKFEIGVKAETGGGKLHPLAGDILNTAEITILGNLYT